MERIGIYEWTVVLIGMGTVFTALIGLSLILSVFSVVSRLRSGGKAGARGKAAAASSPSEAAPPAAPSAYGISPEVVAAISAAVAAASGRKPSEIRIARIAPSPAGLTGLNTPVWGYVNRLASSRR